VGQELYEELGRQQIEGSFSTRDMETHDGLKDCVNLLSLRNGTPLKIVIDQGDMAGLAKQSTTEQKTKFLIDRCYSPKVARALAETLTNPRFTQPFYTKGVEFTLDSENGFEIKVEFINFISVPEKLGGG
jgi:hypothetical protein